jgi:peptidoglycan lytic transglycosylase
MLARLLVSLTAAVVLWSAAAETGRAPRAPRASLVSDSARTELAADRYWHAARILRADGVADGEPEDVIVLARAEAGWGNWPEVLELLGRADWLERVDGGSGLYLLGRALEDDGSWAAAAAAYEHFADEVGINRPEAAPALSRRARVLWEIDDRDGALAALGRLVAAPAVRSWTAVELIGAAAEAGDSAGVRALLAHTVETPAAAAVWRAGADARLAAGDSTGATAAYRELLASHEGSRRAEVAVVLGRLRLAAGDTAQARTLLLQGFEGGRASTAADAAQTLIDLGRYDIDLTVRLARAADRAGDGARALKAYDSAAEMAGSELPESARLERARLMATVEARQAEALDELRAIRESTKDARVGARDLDVWRQLRQQQRMSAQAATLRGWLLADYPESTEAIELTWSEGSGAEDRGQLDLALARYAFIAQHAPSSARAGESRMRQGQIHLRRGERKAAADVYEAYLKDFPDGRRWQEAAYWAGRERLEMGDSAAGRPLLERAMREQPTEYYAIMAADLLGVPYSVDVPEGEGPSEPTWLTDGLARLDRLTDAGLPRGAQAEVDRLKERAQGSRPVMLRLAEALIERGRTIDGINLGWALLDKEGHWDRQLLRVAYPFPYRELVRREAEEWGIDPLVLAAIIRQESAFKADAVSPAGAIGLMQVMPPTGAQLARAHGPRPFSEVTLSTPEVNLHLGAAFFVDMSRRYGGDLALVLSAYNAGPTRANRWRAYPEASDPLRFTERIPFTETRGYVKSVRRNLGLYQALYGDE